MSFKIFFYVPSFGVSVGGAEVQAGRLAKEVQSKYEFQVYILSLNGVHIFDKDGNPFRIVEFNQKTSWSIFSRLFHLKSTIFFIINNKEPNAFVHFHTLSLSALVIGVLLKVACFFHQNLNLIYKVTRTGLNSPLQQYSKFSIRSLFFKAQLLLSSKFICLSPAGNRELLQAGVLPENIFLITNGIDPPPQKSLGKWKGRRDIYVVIGRAIKRKCLPQIVNAWLNANRKKSAELLIIGDGPELLELKRHHNHHLKVHNISLLGHLEHENIQKILSVAKYYISASVSEGLSNSLLESMAFGLIPIVRKIPENEFVVAHENNGYLFSSQDELTLLFSATKKSDKEEKLSKSAFCTITENFDITIIASKYIRLIKELIKK